HAGTIRFVPRDARAEDAARPDGTPRGQRDDPRHPSRRARGGSSRPLSGSRKPPATRTRRAQQSVFGGVFSFELDGEFADARAFLEALSEFSLAVSLGGVESLIEHPAGMTHEPIPRETRLENGITDTLIRVSVGIEHPEDLLADLERGFAAMECANAPTTD